MNELARLTSILTIWSIETVAALVKAQGEGGGSPRPRSLPITHLQIREVMHECEKKWTARTDPHHGNTDYHSPVRHAGIGDRHRIHALREDDDASSGRDRGSVGNDRLPPHDGGSCVHL